MKLEQAIPNQGTAESHESFVHIVAPFVARAQATELMEPCQSALDYPAIDTQTTTVRRVALRQERLNTQLPQPFAMRLGVIAPIALHNVGTLAWPAGFAAHCWNRFHQGLELRHIMRVRSGQDRRHRHATGISYHMVLATRFAFVRGVRARLGPLLRPVPMSYLLRHATSRFARRD